MPPRYATCGACGCEREVTPFMKRDPEQQFRPRPRERTDQFYCGCQNDDDLEFENPRQGYGD